MEVILLEKVGKLGGLGDQVTVKNGYGRNFLIPQGKAVPANAANKEAFEARRAELEKAAADKLATAQARADKINELELSITAQAGDEGKLFGSIGARDIAELATGAGIEVTKAEIRLPTGPIRTTGEYEINVQLHAEVSAVLHIIVVAEE